MSERRSFSAAAIAAVFLSFLLASCAEKGGAFFYIDRFWSPVVEAAVDLEEVAEKVRKESGAVVRIERADQDLKTAENLERFLAEKKPGTVFFGSFTAFEIQPVAERNPDVTFVALDAPDSPPKGTPFRWVRFTKDEALREIGSRVRLSLDAATGPKRPVLAVIGAEYLDAYSRSFEAEAFVDPNIQSIRLEAGPKEGLESVKARLAESLKKRPLLCILLAGGQTTALFGTIRKEGPLPLVIAERGKLAEPEQLPIMYSLEKDYAEAVIRGLSRDAKPGTVLDVPMKTRPGTASVK